MMLPANVSSIPALSPLYRSFTLRRSKPDALALLDERSSGLLLAEGSGGY